MRDLISISIAAISRYSLASSRLVLRICSTYARYCARDVGQRDVEDVEVLLADQVQQQVERALERLQEDLQRIRRDVEVVSASRTAARRTGGPRRRGRPRWARWCRRSTGRGRCPSSRDGIGAGRSALGLVDVRLLRARGRRGTRPAASASIGGGPTAGRGPSAARPRAWASCPSGLSMNDVTSDL